MTTVPLGLRPACGKVPTSELMLATPNPEIPMHDLARRHIGLTEAIAEHWTEAARVCLDRHHQPPVTFQIYLAGNRIDAVVNWEPTDDRTKNAWANDTDATEAGAYGLALASLELLAGLYAVRRAETQTGADYYVGPPGTHPSDLESLIRLEVSGTDRGNLSIVSRRLSTKLKQAADGNSDLPAMAAVVGFQAKVIRLAHLEQS